MVDLVLAICAFLGSLIGIVGSVVPVLPGPLLSYAAFLCAYFTSYSTISTSALLIWFAVVVAVTVADYFLPAWMTRRFGGSRAGVIGATVGVFAGFFFFPPLGVIFGPFAGAVAGELLHDRDDFKKALVVGFGSFLAFIVGTGVKLVVTIGMFIHVWADTYPTVRAWAVSFF